MSRRLRFDRGAATAGWTVTATGGLSAPAAGHVECGLVLKGWSGERVDVQTTTAAMHPARFPTQRYGPGSSSSCLSMKATWTPKSSPNVSRSCLLHCEPISGEFPQGHTNAARRMSTSLLKMSYEMFVNEC